MRGRGATNRRRPDRPAGGWCSPRGLALVGTLLWIALVGPADPGWSVRASLASEAPGPRRAAEMPAFPGAVGFGALANGWRGGRIERITNLRDGGEGSLRACAEAVGPRVCVFDVAGTIAADSPIRVGSDVYIAGQSAPGTVQLRLGASSVTPLVIREASDVLIRFLKVRPGPSADPSPSVDAVTIEDGRNIYLDRLSLAFATDENFNVHANKHPTRDITLARSILAFGLDRSNHPKGRHSKGALICSTEHETGECGRVTLYGNLFAHNYDRNPDAKSTALGPVEIIDNVFYDAASQFGEFYDLIGDTTIIYAGNTAIAGPGTRRGPPLPAVEAIEMREEFDLSVVLGENRNVVRDRCDLWRDVAVTADGNGGTIRRVHHHNVAPLGGMTEPSTPDAAFERVVREAGARDPVTGDRDALDARVVSALAACKGGTIDHPDEVGGWPDLPSGPPPVDADGDGIPDAWEWANGLDPRNDRDAWGDADGNGWSDLEDYLEERASVGTLPRRPPRPIRGG